MSSNRLITLGDIIAEAQSSDFLGITDRNKIVSYVRRAVELMSTKANWERHVYDLKMCADCCGCVTLPSFVDTVLGCNVDGVPSIPRNGWFDYHVNGNGGVRGPGSNFNGLGVGLNYFWDDKGWSPILQDLQTPSLLGVICEDPIDGNGSLYLTVYGEVVDSQYNSKDVYTAPVSGPSELGVKVYLKNGYANADAALTKFKRITRVSKPITRGYVKLIAYNAAALSNAVTLGYYAPTETEPSYRRIKVSRAGAHVRIRYRRNYFFRDDLDLVPIPSMQAALMLIKSIILSDRLNVELSDAYEAKALKLLQEIETVEWGPQVPHIQFEPDTGIGTIDLR